APDGGGHSRGLVCAPAERSQMTRTTTHIIRQPKPTTSMPEQRKQLIAWLRDAHAMELSLVKVLENHAKDASDFPEVRERDLQHLDETRRHAELVEQCLEILGDHPSSAKGVMGKAMGKVQ